MKRNLPARRLVSLLSLFVVHCGATVTTVSPDASTDAPPADAAPLPLPEPTAPCDLVAAQCNVAPQQLFRATATGLTGLDGASAQVAVRYVRNEGAGLTEPRGVVVGRTVVRGGSFEACACIPRNADGYPEVAAVVFAPGSRRETARDVARGFYSQRFAVVGPEDMTESLREAPTPVAAEAALAALDERSTTGVLRGLTVRADATVYAGLVADERPIAAQAVMGTVADGSATFLWSMPGRAWPSERVVFVVDENGDWRCDASDSGGTVRRDAAGVATVAAGAIVRGAAVLPLCDALRVGVPRE
jgi:hypothetical protein